VRDLTLFRIDAGAATEISGEAMGLGKPLPAMIEKGMEVLFGERFLASENCSGKKHGGRIDSLIEPYSLRRTRDGNLILHVERADGSGHRSYRVERIQGSRTTTTPFRPRFPIEFSSRGPLHAPPQNRTLVPPAWRASTSRSRSSREYLYECTRCGQQLAHSQRNARLRQYDNAYRSQCSERHGRYVWERY
jgi:hypothetical protein